MVARTALLSAALGSLMVATVTPQSALPRTRDHHPDLQGMWRNNSITPLERPAKFADKAFFSPEEAREFEKTVDAPESVAERIGAIEAVIGGEVNWADRGRLLPSRRTSLVVDPPNGRIPYTADAQQAAAARLDRRQHPDEHPPDGPEDMPLNDRCLIWGAGPPMVPVPYNHNVQIVQTPAYVVIVNEMIHDVRVVPLDGRPHLPERIQQWKGDPRGHWEGEVLVVDTTNVAPKNRVAGSSERVHIIERVSLADAATLRYEFTVDDPATFTKPWSAALTMTRTDDQMFEYACHEGNHDTEIVLRGARAAEKER